MSIFSASLLQRNSLPAVAFCAALALLAASAPSPASADIVTLKSGATVEGRIVAEGSDMVRIEVQISESIKETKTFSMADVAKIEKTAPDKLAFAEVRELLPTPPLMTASDYDEMIRSGPAKFLKNFPDSEHKTDAEAILAELTKEKEQVQGGALKLGENDWVSAADRKLYRYPVEARVRLFRIRQKAKADNLLSALRDFENFEKTYAQTPAHLDGIEDAQNIIKAWGANLQRRLANVDILNQRDEAALKLAQEDQRRQTMEARDAERRQYEELVKREKEQGVRWLSINDRDKKSLETAISIATDELERLQGLEMDRLRAQTEMLTEANRLIGAGDLKEAKLKIAEARNMASSKKSSRSRSSRSKKSSAADTKPTSYSQWLLQEIEDAEAILLAEANAKAAQAKAKAELMKAEDGTVVDGEKAADGEEKDGEGAADEAGAAGDGDKPTLSRAELVAQAKAKAAAEAARKAEEEDKKNSAKDKKKSSNDDSKSSASRAPRADTGGGFNFQYLIYGIAGVLVITVVVMKALGLGGGKSAKGGDGSGE